MTVTAVTWITLAVGALLGSGGGVGIMNLFVTRSRDKTSEQALNTQFAFNAMKDVAEELRTQHTEDRTEIAALKAELAEERKRKR